MNRKPNMGERLIKIVPLWEEVEKMGGRGEKATSWSFVVLFTPTECETQNNPDKINQIFVFF